jgi:hypothetical protein
VRAAAVANGTVIIGPGGAVMLNRYPSDINESYMGRAGSDTIVNVAPNAGGSTRYDLVIARVDDWNKPGGQAAPGALPTDTVAVFKPQIITGVAAGVKTAAELNLNYPAIALARIAIPAGTSAVTNAMITPLREMANPRRKRALLTRQLITGDTDDLTIAGPGGEPWPDNTFVTEVPYWATRARVVATWYQVRVPAGNAQGTIWFKLGIGDAAVVTSQQGYWDTANTNNPHREVYGVADDLVIPAGLRGKSITCGLFGALTSGLAAAAPRVDGSSSIVMDIEFLEAPAEDA